MIPLLFTCEAESQEGDGLGRERGRLRCPPPAFSKSDPAQAGTPGWLTAPAPEMGPRGPVLSPLAGRALKARL